MIRNEIYLQTLRSLSKSPRRELGGLNSLGNMVVSSAIVDYKMGVENYFAIDAAVAMEAYDGTLCELDMLNPETFSTFEGWKKYDPRLWPTEWYQLFDSGDGRHNLTWRDRFGAIPNMYNFYSSGEEVLENPPALPLGSSPPIHLSGENAWVAQEMMKGASLFNLFRLLSHNPFFTIVNASPQGGWGLNTFWYKPVDSGHAGGQLVTRPRTPGQATPGDLSDDALRIQPFFHNFRDSRLTDPQLGSDLARDPGVRAEVLGAGIPALSHATGANYMDKFHPLNSPDRNFNISASDQGPGFETGWPAKRKNGDWGTRWLHSDLKAIAYPYNHKLHEKLVDLGGLNNEN